MVYHSSVLLPLFLCAHSVTWEQGKNALIDLQECFETMQHTNLWDTVLSKQTKMLN